MLLKGCVGIVECYPLVNHSAGAKINSKKVVKTLEVVEVVLNLNNPLEVAA